MAVQVAETGVSGWRAERRDHHMPCPPECPTRGSITRQGLAHLLANHDDQPGAAVRAAYRALLDTMTALRNPLDTLALVVDQFLKVIASR